MDATSLFRDGPDRYIANYNGNCSFDNSSLTGYGKESVSVISGVFNYLLRAFHCPIIRIVGLRILRGHLIQKMVSIISRRYQVEW